MQKREELINKLRTKYIQARVRKIEPEYLEFEEETITIEDLNKILSLSSHFTTNPHNSILLYLCGITNEFNFTKGRPDTIEGAGPDIDVDFDTKDFQKIVDWVIQHWGREHVANILTMQRFKPRGLVRKFFSVSAPKDTSDPAYREHFRTQAEILSKIPDALYGKEPTLAEVISGNPEKRGYDPHPELTKGKFLPWYEAASKLEGMVSTAGIHAAGLVISNNPISDVLPIWYRKTKDEDGQHDRWITQFEMGEVEKLGLCKFDFLRIENLTIIKECLRLLKEWRNIDLDPWSIPDEDPEAYKLLANGYMSGIFQLETSRSIKTLTQKLRPQNLNELSDISALNRPGPMDAGLVEVYLENKARGKPPQDLPPLIADLLKDTYWTLVYQEQVMKIVSTIAGFSLKEADTIRKAMGKKDLSKLLPYKVQFVKGCTSSGLSEYYATNFWDNTLLGFASYAFNLSHSIAYSYITYVCAYLKANYPKEFFIALMGIRSSTLQPEKWAEKAPQYIQEARELGILFTGPDINKSGIEFTAIGNATYFGLTSIKKIGITAAKAILSARKKPFADIKDFLSKVNKQKINSAIFTQLARAGAFDSIGYQRKMLIDNQEAMFNYFKELEEINSRVAENLKREEENLAIQASLEKRDYLKKQLKTKTSLSPEDIQWLEDNKRIALKRPLVIKDIPTFPEIPRYSKLTLAIIDLIEQGKALGCYIEHPAKYVFKDTTKISDIKEKGTYLIGVSIDSIKSYPAGKAKKYYIGVSDGTGSLILPITLEKPLDKEPGDLIKAKIFAGIEETSDENSSEQAPKAFKVYSID